MATQDHQTETSAGWRLASSMEMRLGQTQEGHQKHYVIFNVDNFVFVCL